MSGAAPVRPDLPGMRALLEGARALDDPYGAVLEISLLALALPWEAVSIDLERIDWSRAEVRVPARGGRFRTLALPNAALQSILRIAGSAGGRGQAVTAGRGRRLSHRGVRLDRLQERLAEVSPSSSRVHWNFHGIRAAATDLLTASGVRAEDASAIFGFGRDAAGADDPRRAAFQRERASFAVERWTRLLLDDGRRASPAR